MSLTRVGREEQEPFTWVECPRDAWQGLPAIIATDVKVAFLESLLTAGFRHLDLGSFVSPTAVPQMADTEQVLAALAKPAGADLLCIVANLRGLERAIRCPGVTTVGFPLSVNETFQRRNTGRDLPQAWSLVGELQRECRRAGLDLVIYLSMGFGNPYGEAWSPSVTAGAAERAADLGIERISLADTVGRADPVLLGEVIRETDAALRGRGWAGRLGVHLHSDRAAWPALVQAAWREGVRWFEGALGGVGGCPFAGDDLVGNLPTEAVLPWLADRAGWSPVPLESLPGLADRARGLAAGGAGGAGSGFERT